MKKSRPAVEMEKRRREEREQLDWAGGGSLVKSKEREKFQSEVSSVSGARDRNQRLKERMTHRDPLPVSRRRGKGREGRRRVELAKRWFGRKGSSCRSAVGVEGERETLKTSGSRLAVSSQKPGPWNRTKGKGTRKRRRRRDKGRLQKEQRGRSRPLFDMQDRDSKRTELGSALSLLPSSRKLVRNARLFTRRHSRLWKTFRPYMTDVWVEL